ncbi:1-aminocyclopropane-1-carboxylate deaminase/D-cysteine desulfhydrase [Sediminibacterium sp.]|uniref:1-aminocyclopropane-1-carboxylate deaminase/D-cysteine desulfhydrase n=1 Tax=Sediminibacterium sp. TaxID=1917865 RepID=UPI00273706B8|nr:pyridoxal-phosphate dependent enzyme [Sediminibacterium sp.]MDP3392827.1 pyridoxal-phosphate dependent enzyme [Sediminibacterium sp.]MDP3565949.1 pyridoxal-phosphate dependent enzyme [Sediminibacterium sp.]
MLFDINKITIQQLSSLGTENIKVSTLRTDLIHPIVSGNKWFKLRFYLEEAKRLKCNTIASFGGAYSNHIVALAAACKINGFKSVGFIRGEMNNSPSLQEAKALGMQLHFISRDAYKYKEVVMQEFAHNEWFWINEGGYGINGALGAATILTDKDCSSFSHIICACGTGTMLAGLVIGSNENQLVTGISVLKNNIGLNDMVTALLPLQKNKSFTTIHDYHFGGYAKHPAELIDYMNQLFKREQVPTDIVYTSKLFYATEQLIKQQYFNPNSNILIIHSGGLQGNRSLAPRSLVF